MNTGCVTFPSGREEARVRSNNEIHLTRSAMGYGRRGPRR